VTQGNRYSVVCLSHGCLQSRAPRLRGPAGARTVKRAHTRGAGCQESMIGIYHWHINDETKRRPKAPRRVE
jgi:hypothetical protein